jgi:adenosylcobinamide-phosphate synthase
MREIVQVHEAAAALLLAAILDYLIGDPWGWPHPVQLMGAIANGITKGCIRFLAQGWQRRLAGIGLGLGLVVGSGLVGWVSIYLAWRLHPVAGFLLESLLLASCFAGRSLRLAALDVMRPLAVGKLEAARYQLSRYVGRDTDGLSAEEILRATLETVAENAVDGVTAPLFYAIAGACLPGVGSVPLALAYKAASTLDSTVGYRQEPYSDIGWFSAKLEDRLTWLPCRLTVLTLALLSRQPRRVLALCRRDAPGDRSPNSGWSECVYAAILGVQLGGINTYKGVVIEKPKLGEPLHPITGEMIGRSLQLTRTCFLLWLAGGIGVMML